MDLKYGRQLDRPQSQRSCHRLHLYHDDSLAAGHDSASHAVSVASVASVRRVAPDIRRFPQLVPPGTVWVFVFSICLSIEMPLGPQAWTYTLFGAPSFFFFFILRLPCIPRLHSSLVDNKERPIMGFILNEQLD